MRFATDCTDFHGLIIVANYTDLLGLIGLFVLSFATDCTDFYGLIGLFYHGFSQFFVITDCKTLIHYACFRIFIISKSYKIKRLYFKLNSPKFTNKPIFNLDAAK